MQPRTHLSLDPRLSGAPLSLADGQARVQLETLPEMAADARGLVHGGFVFGLADYAAMLAINEPNVVLGSADVRLLVPVVVGEGLRAEAKRVRVDGKKQIVEVSVFRHPAEGSTQEGEGERVFFGTFVCFVPDVHVLDAKLSARAGAHEQEKADP
jgi:acyl-coenzyme A thioesterase PaaI-like protein